VCTAGIEGRARIGEALMWGELSTAWVLKSPRVDVGRVDLAWRA
jgi:hypothetical protein